MAPIDDLAQALNRQVTDDQGQIEENETPQEEQPTSEQQTTVEEDAPAVKPAESEDTEPKPESKEDEIDLVELASDETGKRYVPESRFKEVYGKGKAAERENEQLKHRIQELESQGYTPKQAKAIAEKPLDKTDAVEIELLRATLPQFNSDNSNYSRDLDEMGFEIFKSNPGITRIEAARRAVARAKKLSSNIAKEVAEARSVKFQQSDQGITSRVTSRETSNDTPGEDASPEEMEKWLKAHGQW